jgi:hypothetical protein
MEPAGINLRLDRPTGNIGNLAKAQAVVNVDEILNNKMPR